MPERVSTARNVIGVLRVEWDRALAGGLAFASIVLAVATYRGVARTPFVADQLSYLASGGVGALLCAAAAITLYLSAEHHDEWRQLDRIEGLLRTAQASAAGDGDGRRTRTGDHSVVSEPRPSPRARDLATVAATATLAVVVVLVGWRTAAVTGDAGRAASGLRTSLLGALALTAVCAAHASLARQRLLARRAALFDGVAPVADVRPWSPGVPASSNGSNAWWSAGGLSRFHDRSCPALVGLDARPIPSDTERTDLRPCDLCIGGDS
jgi:hypothetical protein